MTIVVDLEVEIWFITPQDLKFIEEQVKQIHTVPDLLNYKTILESDPNFTMSLQNQSIFFNRLALLSAQQDTEFKAQIQQIQMDMKAQQQEIAKILKLVDQKSTPRPQSTLNDVL